MQKWTTCEAGCVAPCLACCPLLHPTGEIATATLSLFPQVFRQLFDLGTFAGGHGAELLPIVDKDGVYSLERYQHVGLVIAVHVHKLERNRDQFAVGTIQLWSHVDMGMSSVATWH